MILFRHFNINGIAIHIIINMSSLFESIKKMVVGDAPAVTTSDGLIKVPINPSLQVVTDNYGYRSKPNVSSTWLSHLQSEKRVYDKSIYEMQWLKETVPATHCGRAFLGAIMEAYNNHKDLVLSPDDIWMVICLNFTNYVNKNAEALRKQFVSHDGKKKLSVTDNHYEGQARWDDFFGQMREAIKQNTVGDITDTLTADFSTTTPVSFILSSACIMDVFKQYFEYGRCVPCCGIQNVHFMGTVADWENLLAKLQKLAAYGSFGGYVSKVEVIIKKFIQSMEGNIDVKWWNQIMNIEHGRVGSGSTTYISGWINHFYLGARDRMDAGDLSLDNICVPVVVDDHMDMSKSGTVYVVGGFYGYNEENFAVRPSMSLAVISDLSTRPGYAPKKP